MSEPSGRETPSGREELLKEVIAELEAFKNKVWWGFAGKDIQQLIDKLKK